MHKKKNRSLRHEDRISRRVRLKINLIAYQLPPALAGGWRLQMPAGFSRIFVDHLPFGFSLNFAEAIRMIDICLMFG